MTVRRPYLERPPVGCQRTAPRGIPRLKIMTRAVSRRSGRRLALTPDGLEVFIKEDIPVPVSQFRRLCHQTIDDRRPSLRIRPLFREEYRLNRSRIRVGSVRIPPLFRIRIHGIAREQRKISVGTSVAEILPRRLRNRAKDTLHRTPLERVHIRRVRTGSPEPVPIIDVHDPMHHVHVVSVGRRELRRDRIRSDGDSSVQSRRILARGRHLRSVRRGFRGHVPVVRRLLRVRRDHVFLHRRPRRLKTGPVLGQCAVDRLHPDVITERLRRRLVAVIRRLAHQSLHGMVRDTLRTEIPGIRCVHLGV